MWDLAHTFRPVRLSLLDLPRLMRRPVLLGGSS
jgi:hypothetical protein